MKEELPISLVIPCYNRIRQTRALLHSLLRCNYSCQVILIDDCSSDDIQSLLGYYSALNITYYRNDINRGPAYSRNIGVQLSKFDLVAFTDNDCILTGEWLCSMYDSIRSTNANVAGVGGKIVAKHTDIISLYFVYHKILDPWFYNGRFIYIVTANAIFKKAAICEVGGFDESIKFAGGEDPGLCFKIINKGYSFKYNPEAVVIHDFSKSWWNFIRTFYRYGQGCNIQSRRHFSPSDFSVNNCYGGLDNQST